MEQSFQSRTASKRATTKAEMLGLPVWQILLLLWCICAIAFFAIRLAGII
jgi:predicted membrane protein